MTNKFRILFLAGLIFISFQMVYAHASQHPQFYLQKTGVLDSLYSQILKEYREINIQLPAKYSPGNNQKYPVVYFLDGEVFLPAAANVLDLNSGGSMPEMLLIEVSNKTNRMRDLTTFIIKTMNGRPFNE
jgi:predicted alpha/beta superfamily hydrolase